MKTAYPNQKNSELELDLEQSLTIRLRWCAFQALASRNRKIMIDQRLYEEFRDIGRDIFVTGMTSSHGGNMSVRVGDKIIIKRRGAQFGRLKRTDFVETSFKGKDSGIIRASTELIVHRAIYEKTSALAVVHAHPRTAIVLSLMPG